MAACVTCVFAVTLSVFPVITVRVQTVYKDNVGWGETPRRSVLFCHIRRVNGRLTFATARQSQGFALDVSNDDSIEGFYNIHCQPPGGSLNGLALL